MQNRPKPPPKKQSSEQFVYQRRSLYYAKESLLRAARDSFRKCDSPFHETFKAITYNNHPAQHSTHSSQNTSPFATEYHRKEVPETSTSVSNLKFGTDFVSERTLVWKLLKLEIRQRAFVGRYSTYYRM